jgi:hypothetical protein
MRDANQNEEDQTAREYENKERFTYASILPKSSERSVVEQLAQSCEQVRSCFAFYYQLIFATVPIPAISK